MLNIKQAKDLIKIIKSKNLVENLIFEKDYHNQIIDISCIIFINTLTFINKYITSENSNIKLTENNSNETNNFNDFKYFIELFKINYHQNFSFYYNRLENYYTDYIDNYKIDYEIYEERIPEIQQLFYNKTQKLISSNSIIFYLNNEVLLKYLTFRCIELYICDSIITNLIPNKKNKIDNKLKIL